MKELKDYLSLQNGSDIRGIAIDGVINEKINFTKTMAENISIAFINFLKDKTNKNIEDIKIGIGTDPRLSKEIFKQGVINGIEFQGGKSFDCNIASTPSMFMSTIFDDFDYDGGIMITASHLPFNRNGMKFFTKDGGLEDFQIKELLNKAYLYSKEININKDYKSEKVDLIERYSNHLKDIIKKEVNSKDFNKPLKGLHIVTDASNGSGGFFPYLVLEPLGANINGSVFLEPDGNFPNHVPNPEDEKAMESIKNATENAKADLGIIFDTDVDRAAVVFSNGNEINKNSLIGLISGIISKNYGATTIVTDSVTSNFLTKFLEDDLGLKHHRFKRGYKNVINEAIRLNKEGIDSQLAMETSGHGALKENYFLDDGAYLCVKIICELAKSKENNTNFEDLIKNLKHPVESVEYRIKISDDNFSDYGKNLIDEFQIYIKSIEGFQVTKENYEGIRVNFNYKEINGWLLLRLSLHDPILVLNIETSEINGEEEVKKVMNEFLSTFEKVSKI